MKGNSNFVKLLKKNMQRITFYFFVLLLTFGSFACKEKKGYPKPDNLVSEEKMVDILYDIHLGEAYSEKFRYAGDTTKLESKDLYFSILEEHKMQDSIFAESVVYYSSMPKIYARIYQQVIDRLKMLQEESNKKEEVNIQPEK
ncbi:DUF4296 domain-containing protein [uncultured Sunxiuqinia sp.]|uniref:DUF4296 domain-containing protein n=1 Tax=uncultured Sunxiuqinia sp. TaxID=1573825 RepID=UPI002AA7079B|nr:DUF4296 domain-containing protein [uncultured Sunxiuqinia sp.]